MTIKIPDSHRDLIDGPFLVSLTTLMPDGSPQSTPVWCNSRDDVIWINTTRGRQKEKNMKRDPRVSILVLDPTDNFRYLSIRGLVAEATESGAVDHIHELARLYTDHQGYYGYFQDAELESKETRVIYKIKPTRILKL
ncbi:MAG: PPOX class F420-dependent oxidoreductase [Anaerolineae bacterium]|nr:MAG: PPOX class F420-dependent oxidoreductase [Anaerolineae bacterium]